MKNNEEKFYNMDVVSRELLNNSEEQIKKCANNLKTKIKDYPFLSMGMAMITGAILSKLSFRNISTGIILYTFLTRLGRNKD